MLGGKTLRLIIADICALIAYGLSWCLAEGRMHVSSEAVGMICMFAPLLVPVIYAFLPRGRSKTWRIVLSSCLTLGWILYVLALPAFLS